jgi:hypothetical protein
MLEPFIKEIRVKDLSNFDDVFLSKKIFDDVDIKKILCFLLKIEEHNCKSTRPSNRATQAWRPGGGERV